MTSPNAYDVIIIGAGAAGMMCAIEAGKRGRKVLVLDHADAAGEKIRISGGGRCNFTNIHATPANFLSANPHFCKSALSRFTQHDFLKMVERHGIAWHEKTLGQLFCDDSAKQIINMLLDEMEDVGVELRLGVSVQSVAEGYTVETSEGALQTQSLVIATGGLSIPKMGATGFAYDIAAQFDVATTPTRAGLVPLTFAPDLLAKTKELSGLSVDPCAVTCGKTTFNEAILLTHKGISGPAILQISSYWKEGDAIIINLLPNGDIYQSLRDMRQGKNKSMLRTALAAHLPARLADMIAQDSGFDVSLQDLSDEKLQKVADMVHKWRVQPVGTEGYRTAEVTLGGIDTAALSSKTMEVKSVAGLYFIGECVDVTGWLGGFNFQWAWASGWCAGQYC